MNNLSVYSSFGLESFFDPEKKCELFVDMIPNTEKNFIRFLWLMEPPEMHNIQNAVIQNKHKFDLILCWQQNIIDACENAKFFAHGTSWVSNFNLGNKKEFCITSIVGGKTYTGNQMLRQKLPSLIAEINTIPLVLFNSSNNPYVGEPKIEKTMKSPLIKNELFFSQFHIAIENSCHINYFTEKLIDCFQTKTVPIYLGCPNIGDFFDVRGMIIVNSLGDIITACNLINQNTYSEMLEYVNANYELSKKYCDFKENIRTEINDFLTNTK